VSSIILEPIMCAFRRAETVKITIVLCRTLAVAAALSGAIVAAQAQPAPPSQSLPPARIIVIGEGRVSVAPDYAEVRAGATTRAKTARDAADANSKLMIAITAALTNAGIAEKDIQTARFSVQPVYTAPLPGAEQKLTGFAVSNQVTVKVRDIAKLGDTLDRLLAAGATDLGNVEFLHADPSKALDAARDAALADARRKAELYARAANLTLGGVAWITEDAGYAPPTPMLAMRAAGGAGAAPPIAAGEDTLHARITVGFAIAQ
jgi:uncharacterized protein YggE